MQEKHETLPQALMFLELKLKHPRLINANSGEILQRVQTISDLSDHDNKCKLLQENITKCISEYKRGCDEKEAKMYSDKCLRILKDLQKTIAENEHQYRKSNDFTNERHLNDSEIEKIIRSDILTMLLKMSDVLKRQTKKSTKIIDIKQCREEKTVINVGILKCAIDDLHELLKNKNEEMESPKKQTKSFKFKSVSMSNLFEYDQENGKENSPESKLERMETELATEKSKHTSTENKLLNSESVTKDLLNKLEECQKQLKSKEDTNRVLKEHFNKLEKKLKENITEQDYKIKNLNIDIDKQKTSIVSLRKEKHKIEMDLDKKGDELRDLDLKCKELVKNESLKQKMESIEKKLEHAQNELIKKDKTIADFNIKHKDMVSKNKSLEKEIADLKTKLERKNKKFHRSVSELEDLNEKYKINIKNNKTEINDLSTQLSEIKNLSKEESKYSREYTSKVNCLIDNITKLNSTEDSYEDVFEREVEEFRKTIERRFNSISNDLNSYSNQIRCFKGDSSSKDYLHIREMLQRLQSELDNMQNIRDIKDLKRERKYIIKTIIKLDESLEEKVVSLANN